jgi:hypothetical protein
MARKFLPVLYQAHGDCFDCVSASDVAEAFGGFCFYKNIFHSRI